MPTSPATASTPVPSVPSLPPPPGPLFLAGLGGIGMSALAQLLRWQGYTVAGSDRETAGPGRDELYAKLRAQGITIWPQDGSGVRAVRPALLVYSTALEEDNPDFAATAELGCAREHRARALAAALNRLPGRQIAVAGSAGKTSVTAWLASTLRHLGLPTLCVGGGYSHEACDARHPGNFSADPNPEGLVAEVDESDGSLTAFTPDYGVLLNVGTDHFSRDHLLELFQRFLRGCREGAVFPASLAHELHLPPDLPAFQFQPAGNPPPGNAPETVVTPEHYHPGPDGCDFSVAGLGRCQVRQYGRHSAANAAAVIATLRLLGLPPHPEAWRNALGAFRGVARRFDRAGTTATGLPVYDDYAHNVEKIGAAIATAQDAHPDHGLLILFQPHGFGPFKFMRDALLDTLRRQLRPADRIALLPVYYAGGTSTFTPTAHEVADGYRAAGLDVLDFLDKPQAASFIADGANGAAAILVLGARDPALPAWCHSLCAPGTP